MKTNNRDGAITDYNNDVSVYEANAKTLLLPRTPAR